MDKNLIRILKEKKYEPEENLASVIWDRILKRERKMARIKFYLFLFFGIFSFAGSIPIFKSLLNDLSKSGIYEYLSVAFSENEALSSYWRELSFSVTEALPIVSILYTLAISFIFFLSLKYAIRQITQSRLGINYHLNY